MDKCVSRNSKDFTVRTWMVSVAHDMDEILLRSEILKKTTYKITRFYREYQLQDGMSWGVGESKCKRVD